MEIQGSMSFGGKTISPIKSNVEWGRLVIGKERYSIALKPFCKEYLINSDIRNGFSMDVSGHGIGDMSHGPIGHPGDQEYITWELLSYTIKGKFSLSGLKVDIVAKTGEGIDPFSNNQKHPKHLVKVSMFIPITQIDSYVGSKGQVPFSTKVKQYAPEA